MPNWCSNTLLVSGDPERIKQFIEEQKGVDYDHEGTPTGETALTFENVVPMPEHLRGTKAPSDDGSMTWYDWSVENWGTKWDACYSQISHNPGENVVEYMFDTAWSPPVDWYEKVIEAYPDLDFTLDWEEGGMGFAGTLSGEKGIVGGIREWNIVWDEDGEEYVPVP